MSFCIPMHIRVRPSDRFAQGAFEPGGKNISQIGATCNVNSTYNMQFILT